MKKTSLDYILNPSGNGHQALDRSSQLEHHESAIGTTDQTISSRLNSSTSSSLKIFSSTTNNYLPPSSTRRHHEILQSHPLGVSIESKTLQKKRVRKIYLCEELHCDSIAVSRSRCVRHGGGTRCSAEKCHNAAKLNGKCFQHGGWKVCSVDGCTSKAKRYGKCWSHGGGAKCKEDGCSKMATMGGLCWSHGGGNRCKVDGCLKRSYRKNNYLCTVHTLASSVSSSSPRSSYSYTGTEED